MPNNVADRHTKQVEKIPENDKHGRHSPSAPVPLANGPPIERARLAEAVAPNCRRGGQEKAGSGHVR